MYKDHACAWEGIITSCAPQAAQMSTKSPPPPPPRPAKDDMGNGVPDDFLEEAKARSGVWEV